MDYSISLMDVVSVGDARKEFYSKTGTVCLAVSELAYEPHVEISP